MRVVPALRKSSTSSTSLWLLYLFIYAMQVTFTLLRLFRHMGRQFRFYSSIFSENLSPLLNQNARQSLLWSRINHIIATFSFSLLALNFLRLEQLIYTLMISLELFSKRHFLPRSLIVNIRLEGKLLFCTFLTDILWYFYLS